MDGGAIFTRDDRGLINGFTVSSGRVWKVRVPFEFELDAAVPPISHWAVKDVDLLEALAEAGLVRHGGGLLAPAAPAGASQRVAEVLSGLDAAYVTRQWESAAGRIEADPAGAITLARSLLESVLKHLLEELGGDVREAVPTVVEGP